jgi:hypothetical protein
VLAAELLQYVINEVLQLGNLTMLIPHGSGNFPVVQYADDIILLLLADRHQILFLKNLLEQFATSTGLKVYYHISYMIPLNVSNDKIQDLASAFGCQISSMPFTYLGLPWALQSHTLQTSHLSWIKWKENLWLAHPTCIHREIRNDQLSAIINIHLCHVFHQTASWGD